MSDYDIFIRNEIYPNASSIFSAKIQSVPLVKNDCIFVFDTNALLLPYYSSSKNLKSLKSILEYLIKKNRLFIPGQAAREFAANRPDRIKEVFQKLNQQINAIKEISSVKYPLLSEISSYNELAMIEKEYNDFVSSIRYRYKEKINEILKAMKEWTWNDPVSQMYNELFNENIVIDPRFDKQVVKKELDWRYTHKIPPGYKDQSKIDDGVGDLLIWKTILHLGESCQKHLIFVSGEEKSDWLYKSEGQILYPRYELVTEYYSISKGQSFHILKFSEFLELMSGAEDLIQEIERIEDQIFTLDNMRSFQKASDFHFHMPFEETDEIQAKYLVMEELSLIKQVVELYIKMNASDSFFIQHRFIDSITMVYRSGFLEYEDYKHLMRYFTTDNWDFMDEVELEKYYIHLEQLRQTITKKLGFIRPLGEIL